MATKANNKTMKYYSLLFLPIFTVFCNGQVNKTSLVSQIDSNHSIDSVEIVAKYFLEFSDYYNSYVVSDNDIAELYQGHKDWVKKYFPNILAKYDITLYARFEISCYLHLAGDKEYLKDFWQKYDRTLQSIGRKEEFTNNMKYLEIKME